MAARVAHGGASVTPRACTTLIDARSPTRAYRRWVRIFIDPLRLMPREDPTQRRALGQRGCVSLHDEATGVRRHGLAASAPDRSPMRARSHTHVVPPQPTVATMDVSQAYVMLRLNTSNSSNADRRTRPDPRRSARGRAVACEVTRVHPPRSERPSSAGPVCAPSRLVQPRRRGSDRRAIAGATGPCRARVREGATG